MLQFLYYYNEDYYTIGEELFKNIQQEMALVCGILACCILIPIYFNFYNIAEKQFNKRYPNEKVIYVVKNGIFFMLVVTFLIGESLGLYILPFFIFQNVPVTITPWNNLFITIIIYIVTYYIVLERFSIIYILSDERIQLIRCLYTYKFNLKINSVKYKNIESVRYNKFLTWEYLDIKLKDGKDFNGLLFFKNLKHVKSIIEKYIKKEVVDV
ncbi:hypothetical protein DBY21_00945 [Candidatus Gastranaerophilales bacterium]|nr:MAG: hypothetical protein DBY21_00945 [Candidatus Gastranaerophilales bacterium]